MTSQKMNGCYMYSTTQRLVDSIIYALLTKCEVKMAGYRPSSFFAFLLTETEKTEQGQYPAVLTK